METARDQQSDASSMPSSLRTPNGVQTPNARARAQKTFELQGRGLLKRYFYDTQLETNRLRTTGNPIVLSYDHRAVES